MIRIVLLVFFLLGIFALAFHAFCKRVPYVPGLEQPTN